MKMKSLDDYWKDRLATIKEADKLFAKAKDRRAEYDELYLIYWDMEKRDAEYMRMVAKADKVFAESERLEAEASRMRAIADKIWAEAVLECRGNITMRWEWGDEAGSPKCHLETGEVFQP